MRCSCGASMERIRNLLFGNSSETHYRLHVITGDRRGAGTDANVYVILHDRQGHASQPISLNKVFSNDNERGSTTTLELKEDCGIAGPVARVEVWRDNFADLSIIGTVTEYLLGSRTKRGSSAWFLDRVEVEEMKVLLDAGEKHQQEDDGAFTVHRGSSGGRLWVFPLQRWVAAHKHYTVHLHDCFLPQSDPQPETREEDIRLKRLEYKYEQKVEGGPAQVIISTPQPLALALRHGRGR